MRAQTDPTATTGPAATTAASTSTPAATEVVTGTPAVRPTPEGAPPADPFQSLSVFAFVDPGNLAVKRDRLQLTPGGVDNVLITLTESRLGVNRAITEEVDSAFGVVAYDPQYREWNLIWSSSPVSGTARLLPAVGQPGGWNGGTLLGSDDRVLALRTSTLDGGAHLYLYRWNPETNQGEPLRMAPVGDGPEQNAAFHADLDVNMADLNDDGRWEVIADNVAGVQVWQWDGSKYAPLEVR